MVATEGIAFRHNRSTFCAIPRPPHTNCPCLVGAISTGFGSGITVPLVLTKQQLVVCALVGESSGLPCVDPVPAYVQPEIFHLH